MMAALHQYACLICRSRKIKCDRIIPACANCIDAGTQCIYAARRSRKRQKIHHVVQQPLLPAHPSYPSPPTASSDMHETTPEPQMPISVDDMNSEEDSEDIVIPREVRDSAFEAFHDTSHTDNGRLFVAQGKSRYINSDKANQVVHLEFILATEQQTKSPSPGLFDFPKTCLDVDMTSSSLLGVYSSKWSLQTCHPTPKSMEVLWQYYTHNVDILIKILYKPAVESVVKNASSNLYSLNASTEALLFAIWFAAVTTMSKEECQRLLKEDRKLLLPKYRQALEQALAQAGWVTSQEIEVLQALILFMVCAPAKTARSTWMMSGIALSIAQAMGMHSDSASFGLGLVDTEVRRRVWWSLCQLDDRISGDCGLEPHVPLNMDTKFPLHTNDSDLNCINGDLPAPRTEFTEMTATLLKIKVAEVSIKTKRSKLGGSPLSISETNHLIRERIGQFEVYLTYFDLSITLHRLLDLGARLIIARAWKLMYDHAEQRTETTDGNLNEPLIFYNANVLEITSQQYSDDFRQFSWFFRCKYLQWHAIAYLLVELGKYAEVKGPAVDRAWNVLDSLFDKHQEQQLEETEDVLSVQLQNKKSALWLPLQTLYNRAKEAKIQVSQTQNSQSDLAPVDKSISRTSFNVTSTDDPFLGFGMGFDEGVSWEQVDAWLKEIQPSFSSEMGLE